jgi:hypothetical protein
MTKLEAQGKAIEIFCGLVNNGATITLSHLIGEFEISTAGKEAAQIAIETLDETPHKTLFIRKGTPDAFAAYYYNFRYETEA